MLRWWTDFRRASESRQLNRDSPLIISHTLELFQPKIVTEVATLTRDHIARAHKQYGSKIVDLKRAHFDYKRLHKEARKRADQTTLSAMTLTIIYLRAEMAGPSADPARNEIDAFLRTYAEDADA